MKNNNIWFTSDTHLGHYNIIKYCNRPFTSVQQMDETIIRNWNSVVQPEDTIYHLGDFTFYREEEKVLNLLRRLNGTKIFVFGNHDKVMWNQQVRKQFSAMYPFHEINIDKQRITLCHYAMKVWNGSHRGSWQLYGHSHGTIPDPTDALQIDVGVDCHGFTPISFEQIGRLMAKKTFKPVDHHGAT
jgi:calcineurin-like phosphoesterase family protein